MKTASTLAFILLVHFTGGDSSGQEARSLPWKAGVARVNITPAAPMWMAGYGARTKPAAGKLADLWAKVLILKDEDGDRAVLITLDLVGIDRELSGAICKPIIERFGFRREQISICCSHTHTGPALWKNLSPLHYLVVDPEQQRLIREYTDRLPPKIVDAVAEALRTAAPARLSWGSAEADFAVNRRENRPESDVPALRRKSALKGPVNHDVPVLAIHGGDEKLAAVVFGYACHSTVLSSYRWSGDYPGFAQAEIEMSHPGCLALFWAGCGADQNPIPRRSEALARHYGKRLAAAVDKVLLTTELSPLPGKLSTSFREVELPLEDLPAKEELEATAGAGNRYEVARARMLLDQVEAGQPLAGSYPFPIASWRLGNEIQWVFLGGETVIDYANRLKSEHRGDRTWVASYANDVMAYIPSERVLREGGYEGRDAMVYYGLPANWKTGLEEQIVDEIGRQLSQSNLPRIAVNNESTGFVDTSTGKPFSIWGVNYDHNEQMQLIEDYWLEDWEQVEEDFREMNNLGVNTVRIHLQLGRFMTGAESTSAEHLGRLKALLDLAEEQELYLFLTGLGCYRKADVPDWYDALEEQKRWQVQVRFWSAVAEACAGRPVVLCYDLNERTHYGRWPWIGVADRGTRRLSLRTTPHARSRRTLPGRSGCFLEQEPRRRPSERSTRIP